MSIQNPLTIIMDTRYAKRWRKRSAPARAVHLGKEKPAVRILLTAGVVRPEGFEPPAFGIGIHCDIQLRHGRIG